MNIHERLDLLAGGPGSGCHGDNCGRPEEHAGSYGPARMRIKDNTQVQAANKKMQDMIDIMESTYAVWKKQAKSPDADAEDRRQEIFYKQDLKTLKKVQKAMVEGNYRQAKQILGGSSFGTLYKKEKVLAVIEEHKTAVVNN